VLNYKLDKKDADIKSLASNAMINDELFKELMKGILSKDNNIRQNSFKALQSISMKNPEFLYPQWDQFSEMLNSKNNYHKYIAVYLLADLTAVDSENKFDEIFDDYFMILGGNKAMTASHVALNSSKIALNKSELQDKIIDILLNIDNIHQGKQKELIKAYAIGALMKMYPEIKDKKRVMNFIKEQLDSPSPKTRDAAAFFIERCE
jgi:hypothetical protein